MKNPPRSKGSRMAAAAAFLGICFGSGLSAESTHPLQPRDLDGNPATIEAYYFVPGDLTWLADANLGLSETFGLQRAEYFSDYGSEVNQEGRMLEEGLMRFIEGMNASAYLGHNAWRLPFAIAEDPGCAVTIDPDFVWAAGENCSGPEVGNFNQFLNTFYGGIDNSPFVNLASNNGGPALHGHWLSSGGPSGRNYFSFGGAGELRFCGSGRCGGRYVWPVHDGDIGSPDISTPSAQCVDTDGDGWGWDGVTSCRVGGVETSCIDSPPVGDGWGWDGTTSCRIEVTETVCEDTPPTGDGWGWNGVTSCRIEVTDRACVDTPPVGDGWGWDGVVSCEVSTQLPRLILLSPQVADYLPCLDSPPVGDGWGWNGNESCRVLPNLIQNGDLAAAGDQWTTYVHPGADQTQFNIREGVIVLSYRDAGTEWWHSQVYSASFALEAGQTYRLEFNHSSSSGTGRATGSVVVENATTFEKHLDRQDFNIGIGKNRSRVDFTVDRSDSNARLTFNLGDNAGGNNSENRGTLFLDNITLRAIDTL